MIKNYNKVSNITINFIVNHILIIMFLSIVILSIVIFITKHDLKFLIAPSIAFFVPFLIIKFNKHKEEKQNEDFRKIINTSIFNCLEHMQVVLNKSELHLISTFSDEDVDNIKRQKNNKKFNNPYYRHDNARLNNSKEIKEIYEYTRKELENIENSKLQFQDYDNFILVSRYRKIIDKYEDNSFDSFDFTPDGDKNKTLAGNYLYQELYEILEINKEQIKEMIIE
nr:hypothetical protein GTC16762_33930 [Pigmentibacter ruber]